ncbi:hypothetical protein P9705_001261 [Enterococcus faecalis]|nr:hypothetical protein [Enterococcus faecalis]
MPIKREEKYIVKLPVNDILTLEHLTAAKIEDLNVTAMKEKRNHVKVTSLRHRAKQYAMIKVRLVKARMRKRTINDESFEFVAKTMGKEEIINMRKNHLKYHRKRSYRG